MIYSHPIHGLGKSVWDWMHYGRMTGLGHWDKVPMVSALVCIVAH